MIFELPVFSLFPTCQILYFFSHLCFFYFSFFIEITLVYNIVYILYVYLSEKAMAPHFSILAWKIPWMEEPGRLQSMGSLRVRHD